MPNQSAPSRTPSVRSDASAGAVSSQSESSPTTVPSSTTGSTVTPEFTTPTPKPPAGKAPIPPRPPGAPPRPTPSRIEDLVEEDLDYRDLTTDHTSSVCFVGRRIVREYRSEFVLPNDMRIAVNRKEMFVPGAGRMDVYVDLSHAVPDYFDELVFESQCIENFVEDDEWAIGMLMSDGSKDGDLLRQLEEGCREEPELYKVERIERRKNKGQMVSIRNDPVIRNIHLFRNDVEETKSLETDLTSIDMHNPDENEPTGDLDDYQTTPVEEVKAIPRMSPVKTRSHGYPPCLTKQGSSLSSLDASPPSPPSGTDDATISSEQEMPDLESVPSVSSSTSSNVNKSVEFKPPSESTVTQSAHTVAAATPSSHPASRPTKIAMSVPSTSSAIQSSSPIADRQPTIPLTVMSNNFERAFSTCSNVSTTRINVKADVSRSDTDASSTTKPNPLSIKSSRDHPPNSTKPTRGC